METGPNAILNHPIALEVAFLHKDSVETEGRHLSLIVNNKSCKKVTSQYESCIELPVACDYLNQLECDALI